jgi:NTP pyrophosphatase (non-canonical NTP hydrolase)
MTYSFKNYQTESAHTAIYPREKALEYVTLGLVGEAGEIANKVKKIIRDNGGVVTPEQASQIAAEVGDVLWYVAALSRELGVDLGEVAQANIQKLTDRQARGVIGGSGDNR